MDGRRSPIAEEFSWLACGGVARGWRAKKQMAQRHHHQKGLAEGTKDTHPPRENEESVKSGTGF